MLTKSDSKIILCKDLIQAYLKNDVISNSVLCFSEELILHQILIENRACHYILVVEGFEVPESINNQTIFVIPRELFLDLISPLNEKNIYMIAFFSYPVVTSNDIDSKLNIYFNEAYYWLKLMMKRQYANLNSGKAWQEATFLDNFKDHAFSQDELDWFLNLDSSGQRKEIFLELVKKGFIKLVENHPVYEVSVAGKQFRNKIIFYADYDSKIATLQKAFAYFSEDEKILFKKFLEKLFDCCIEELTKKEELKDN